MYYLCTLCNKDIKKAATIKSHIITKKHIELYPLNPLVHKRTIGISDSFNNNNNDNNDNNEKNIIFL